MTNISQSVSNKAFQPYWIFTGQWLLTNSLGFGLMLFWYLLFTIIIMDFPCLTLPTGIAFMVIWVGVGVLQYYVLRKYYSAIDYGWVKGWINAIVISYNLYYWFLDIDGRLSTVNLSSMLVAILNGIYIGLCIGGIQYFYLRKFFSRASLWIIANLSAWIISLFAIEFFAITNHFLRGLVIGLIYSIITVTTLTRYMSPITTQDPLPGHSV